MAANEKCDVIVNLLDIASHFYLILYTEIIIQKFRRSCLMLFGNKKKAVLVKLGGEKYEFVAEVRSKLIITGKINHSFMLMN